MRGDLKRAASVVAVSALALAFGACSKNQTPPTTPTPPSSPSASLVVTFDENPVPYRGTGCNASNPQGWYTAARLQEKGGVAFTPGTFTQKLDGNVNSILSESFGSRFGACAGSAFNEGVIPANGTVCGIVGVCTSGTFTSYQFELTGTDANGHALTYASPVVQLGPR
jgi:hypothetical protein